jgi:SAM-dependent methyltransferase
MSVTESARGSAGVQGKLWGQRVDDWSELMEPANRELYPPVLAAAGVGTGTKLLDLGCGSGVAAEVATGLGAEVTGLDATAPFVAVARTRVPSARFHVGELEELQFADDSFDVVTGFNSFQYAANPARALSEARRVARPGGTVAIVTWGRPEACEAAATLAALGSFLPPPPPGAPGPFALSEPGALEELAHAAGLEPVGADEVEVAWEFEDEPAALRAMLSAGPAARAIEAGGEAAVAAAISRAIAPYRTATGGYSIENTWRYLLAAA